MRTITREQLAAVIDGHADDLDPAIGSPGIVGRVLIANQLRNLAKSLADDLHVR